MHGPNFWCYINIFVKNGYTSIDIYFITLQIGLNNKEEKVGRHAATKQEFSGHALHVGSKTSKHLCFNQWNYTKPNRTKNMSWSKCMAILKELHNTEKWEMSFEQLKNCYFSEKIWK